jgi:hypothetical protein
MKTIYDAGCKIYYRATPSNLAVHRPLYNKSPGVINMTFKTPVHYDNSQRIHNRFQQLLCKSGVHLWLVIASYGALGLSTNLLR